MPILCGFECQNLYNTCRFQKFNNRKWPTHKMKSITHFKEHLPDQWLMWCRAYVLQQLLFLANIIINFPNPKPRCETYNNTKWRYIYIKGYNFSFIKTRLCILNISWAERVLARIPVLTGQTRCKIWKSTKILLSKIFLATRRMRIRTSHFEYQNKLLKVSNNFQ